MNRNPIPPVVSLLRTGFLLAAVVCGSVIASDVGRGFTNDFDAIVKRATARVGDQYLENWAFTETRTADDEVRVASYDPSRGAGGQWQLVSLNGQPPAESVVEAFLEEKAARQETRNKDDDNGLQELITPGSLELIEETAEQWRFAFQPQDEEDEAFMKNVDGEIVVIKDGHYVGSVTMRSRGPFKPRTGLKLNRFETELRFHSAGADGPIVPSSMSTSVSGKAFLVATIEEAVTVNYSEYRLARSGQRQP